MLIVETVEAAGVGAQVGILVEDHLLSYAGQPLLSPAMLQALEENTFGVERVTVLAERAGQSLEFVVPSGKLGLETQPILPVALLPHYQAARSAFLIGDYAEAAQEWADLADRTAGEAETTLWLLGRSGAAWEKAEKGEQAIRVYIAMWERLAGGADTALQSLTATALGRCHESRREWQEAHVWYERAGQADVQAGREMWQARSLNKLGVVPLQRDDPQAAQDYHIRALTIQERLAPDSLEVAQSLNYLGLFIYLRGDLQAAQDYLTRSLTIREHLAPDSLEVAYSLNNLGNVAEDRGDLQAAQDYLTRALTIKERLAPDSLTVATSLGNLGEVAFLHGDLPAAQDYTLRALMILKYLNPDSMTVALNLNNLGNVAHQRGDLQAAQDYHIRAQTIYEHLAPDSLDHSRFLTDLGQTFLDQQQPDQALPYLQQAVQILEQQRSNIRSPEARALLLAQHTNQYASLIRCYLALNQPERAFAIHERSRARSLLELLAERQLDFAAEAPSDLLEQQRTLDQQRERTSAQLAQLSAGAEDREQVNALHLQVRDLERRQQEVAAALRHTSPRYASLQYPQALSLTDAQATLEPGDLLLSYLVDEEQTFLFAVTAHTVKALSLPLGRKTLQARVHSLRELLDWRLGTNRTKTNVEKAMALSRELYSDLIRPAADLLGNAKRLLLCPDGPLHILPFAALVTNARGKPHYLGSERPLQSILSATLYAQSQASRSQSDKSASETPSVVSAPTNPPPNRSSGPPPLFRRLLAFGDPIYSFASAPSTRTSGVNPEDAILEELQTRGLSLGPLPHTRKEVLALKDLFGEAATVKLGAEATRTTALNDSADADGLHFACHGFLDAQMPLHSGLVLSQSERTHVDTPGETVADNGLLQVWEIFQKLRLDAELVVLSACETGLLSVA